MHPHHQREARVVFPVLQPQHGVIGDAGFARHASKVALQALEFGNDLGEGVSLSSHAISLGAYALLVKVNLPRIFTIETA